jgi:PPOX class probable F420-dependent enzyme
MPMDALARFAGHKYLSLETFRRSGVGVRTPLWFAENNGELLLYTLADSGKVKRIRNNPRVRVAPSDMRGKLLGDWTDGQARFLQGQEAQNANRLLNRKYFLKRFFDWTSKLRKTPRVYLAIHPTTKDERPKT